MALARPHGLSLITPGPGAAIIFDALAILCLIAALVVFLVAAFNERITHPAMVPLGLKFVTAALLCQLGPALA